MSDATNVFDLPSFRSERIAFPAACLAFTAARYAMAVEREERGIKMRITPANARPPYEHSIVSLQKEIARDPDTEDARTAQRFVNRIVDYIETEL